MLQRKLSESSTARELRGLESPAQLAPILDEIRARMAAARITRHAEKAIIRHMITEFGHVLIKPWFCRCQAMTHATPVMTIDAQNPV